MAFVSLRRTVVERQLLACVPAPLELNVVILRAMEAHLPWNGLDVIRTNVGCVLIQVNLNVPHQH